MRSISGTKFGPFVNGRIADALVTSTPSNSRRDAEGTRAALALQVLVVDDVPSNLKDAADLLSQWGIVPTTACNGADAVVLAGKRQFDLILMDVCMPVMDGLEAAQQIRRMEIEHPERRRIPIVAYTDGKLLANAPLLGRVGFDEAIKKPCSAPQLEECLRRWCFSGPALLSSQQDNDSSQAGT